MKKSLEDCGLGYIDLYLLHGPIGGPAMRLESWKAAIDSKKDGLFRSIGVSCFSVRHLSELLDAGLEVPTVNQVCERGTSAIVCRPGLRTRARAD